MIGPYQVALEQARIGFAEGGLPIGAALARGREVLATGRNRRVQSGDPTAHAEIDCLRAAGRQRSYAGLTLYTTLTPCYLCSGAVALFDIEQVTIGDSSTYDGGGSLELLRERKVNLTFLHDEAAQALLRQFIAKHPQVWAEDIGES